jgi:hypothetical protein
MIRAHGSLVVALLAGGLLVTLDTFTGHEGESARRETYALKGSIYYVIPDELLRRKGLEFPNVPRNQNAAYDYLAALEAHGSMRGKSYLYGMCERAIRDGWPENAQPLVEYLDDKAEVLALLKQGAAKPACHFPFLTRYEGPLDAADLRVSDLPLPHL